MKKIILLVCAITALCSCGGSGNQNEKKVREVVEAKLKTEMNDWSSYEFISAEAIDTIKYIDNINYRKEYFQKSIENNKEASNYGLDYSSSITKDSIILIGIDSIQNAMGDIANISWENGRYNFKDVPLAQLIQIVSQMYHTDILLQGVRKDESSFSGSIHYNEPLDKVLNKICFSLNLNIRQTDDRIVLY